MPERRGEVRIGDRVVFSGAEYSVVALSGSLVRLLADSGDAVVVAMAYLAGAPDFAVVGAGPGPGWSRPACWTPCRRRWPRRPGSWSGT